MNLYKYNSGKNVKWGYRKRFRGQRLRARGFRTRKEAQGALDARLKKEALKTGTDFLRLCNEYLDYSKTRHATKTYKYKAATIRNLLHFLGGSEWPSSLDVLRYLENRARTTSANAFNADRKDLHSMFEWGKKYGLASTNPVSQVDRMGHKRATRYIPSMDDINRVLLVAGEFRDLLECCLYTLGRKSEILKLKWEDVNFETNKIRLWTRKRKDGSEEYDELPMPIPLGKLLDRKRGRGALSGWVFPSPYKGTSRGNKSGRFSHLSGVMRRLCTKATVKPFGFHAFRHYGASYLIRRGADLKTVQVWLRHRNIETTRLYVHEMPDTMKDAAEILGEMVGTPVGTSQAKCTDSDARARNGPKK